MLSERKQDGKYISGISPKSFFGEYLNTGAFANSLKKESEAVSLFIRGHFILTRFRPIICLILIFWEYFYCFLSDTVVYQSEVFGDSCHNDSYNEHCLDDNLMGFLPSPSKAVAAAGVLSVMNKAESSRLCFIAEPLQVGTSHILRNDNIYESLYEEREINSLLRHLNMRNVIADKMEIVTLKMEKLQSDVENLSKIVLDMKKNINVGCNMEQMGDYRNSKQS